jgi:hypothetical protein
MRFSMLLMRRAGGLSCRRKLAARGSATRRGLLDGGGLDLSVFLSFN